MGIALKGKAAKIPDRADAIVRQVATGIDRVVVKSTPVDTGRARGNWQATLGAPADGVVSTLSPSGAEAIAQADAVIATYRGGPGAVICITNNLPYIVPLNNGHSAQAPAGFVERAVASVERAARRANLIT
jgi:hypothetical protein